MSGTVVQTPGGWDATAENYDAQPFTLAFAEPCLEVTKLKKEEKKDVKVLDLATGTGVVSLAAAQALKGRGSVVATDFSPKMLEVLKGKIQNAKLENISTQIMDAQEIAFPDESFDYVFCLFGIIFMPDPKKGKISSFVSSLSYSRNLSSFEERRTSGDWNME